MASVVIILGAGATLSDAKSAKLEARPPLDRGFFAVSRRFEPALTNSVAKYMKDTYEVDIFRPEDDYLERVMAAVYTDLYNPAPRFGREHARPRQGDVSSEALGRGAGRIRRSPRLRLWP